MRLTRSAKGVGAVAALATCLSGCVTYTNTTPTTSTVTVVEHVPHSEAPTSSSASAVPEQFSDKPVAYCGDPLTEEPGTAYFVDGTKGKSEFCLQQ